MNQITEYLNLNPKFESLIVHILSILVILAGVFISSKAIHYVGDWLLRYGTQSKSARQSQGADQEKRVATIVRLVQTTLRIVLYGFAVLVILKQLGFDITPLLTGAGVAGVAVGFGAQSLVKDVISGFFMLLEDQIRIGDAVKIAGVGGVVEKVNLRTTTLRDADGTVHIIPNGEIKSVSNSTYDFANAIVNIPVSYDVDLKKASEVIQSNLKQYNSAANYDGVVETNATHIVLRMSLRTSPQLRVRSENDMRSIMLSSLRSANITAGVSVR